MATKMNCPRRGSAEWEECLECQALRIDGSCSDMRAEQERDAAMLAKYPRRLCKISKVRYDVDTRVVLFMVGAAGLVAAIVLAFVSTQNSLIAAVPVGLAGRYNERQERTIGESGVSSIHPRI